MINFIKVNKKYGEVSVLKDINITIPSGKVVVVCGPSGSGKSTFIKAINGLEPFDSGAVLVDSQDITTLKSTALSKKVAMVFQDFALFHNKTVLENLTMPLTVVHGKEKGLAKLKANELLEAVSMSAHADKYPHQLSGGQQQRVAIARALVTNPDWLLFDEPTSALDPEMVSDILVIIESLAKKGKTMIVVTHEMGFAKRVADQVVFMCDGRIEEVATNEQFFTNPKSARAREFLNKIIR